MKQEDKDLLLKDLCGRLPYKVRCSFGVDDAVYEICGVNPTCCGASEIQATHVKSGINGDFTINACKPYLFPLSSMTEEAMREFDATLEWITTADGYSESVMTYDSFDCLNKYHIDYRGGLIEKGLAIDCTNLNIY